MLRIIVFCTHQKKKKPDILKIVDCKVVTTLLLANDTHNSDLRTIMHNAQTIHRIPGRSLTYRIFMIRVDVYVHSLRTI